METYFEDVQGKRLQITGASPAQASALVQELGPLTTLCSTRDTSPLHYSRITEGEYSIVSPMLAKVVREALAWTRETDGQFSVIRDASGAPLPAGDVHVHPSGAVRIPTGSHWSIDGFLCAYLADESAGRLRRDGVARGIVSIDGQVTAWGGTTRSPFVHAIEHPGSGTLTPIELIGETGLSSMLIDNELYVTVQAPDVLEAAVACRVVRDLGIIEGRRWVRGEMVGVGVIALDDQGRVDEPAL